MNTVRRNLCDRSVDWRWSSARRYLEPESAVDPVLPKIELLSHEHLGERFDVGTSRCIALLDEPAVAPRRINKAMTTVVGGHGSQSRGTSICAPVIMDLHVHASEDMPPGFVTFVSLWKFVIGNLFVLRLAGSVEWQAFSNNSEDPHSGPLPHAGEGACGAADQALPGIDLLTH